MKNSMEIKEMYLLLEANSDLVFNGAMHCKIVYSSQPIELQWQGKFDAGAIIDNVTDKIKEKGTEQLNKITKNLTVAVGTGLKNSKEIASKAFNEASELAKTASKHVTHSQNDCDSKCVPDFAKKLATPLFKGSNVAVDKFYESVINDLVNIASETDQETRKYRSDFVKADWDQLCSQIDNSWEDIIGRKDYTRFYILQSSAENGGKIFRKLVREQKDKHSAYRNQIWEKMMTAESEDAKEVALKGDAIPDGIYFIQSAMAYGNSNKGFLEFPGGYPAWTKKGNAMGIWTTDGGANKKFYFEKRLKSPYYAILSGEVKNRKIAVDCRGGQTTNGTPVQGYESFYVPAQQFYLKHMGNGVFKIYHASGKVVCLQNNKSIENGNKVHLWDDHNLLSTQWVLINASTGQKYIPGGNAGQPIMNEVKNNTPLRLQNVWKKTYINIETGPISCTAADPGWSSAKWIFEPVEGTQYVRIKNKWKNTYLNIETGGVQCSAVQPGWASAKWIIEKVEGTNQVRIKNVWKNTYLNIESGNLQCTTIQPGWSSAKWVLE